LIIVICFEANAPPGLQLFLLHLVVNQEVGRRVNFFKILVVFLFRFHHLILKFFVVQWMFPDEHKSSHDGDVQLHGFLLSRMPDSMGTPGPGRNKARI
jgi:hypothetical protein